MPADTLTKGERTRLLIIDAAYSLFIEQGFHATSMRQIAQQAGIALGGIYNHFESKEQIFEAVLFEKHPYRQVLAIIQDAPMNDLEDFIKQTAQTMVAQLGKDPEILKLAFVELIEFRGQHAPRLYQVIFPQFLPLIERFRQIPGQMRCLSPQAVIFSFLGTFFGYYMSQAFLLHPNEALDPLTLEEHLRIFLHGVMETENP